MDEQHPARPDGPEPTGWPRGPRTGVATVDAVTASIEALHARPVAEHPSVFEAAHETLRRALDSDPDAGASAPPED